MRGRKPKPTALKLLGGNPGKRRLNALEPVLAPGVPECPATLTDEAKREWFRISSELVAAGLLTCADRAALAAYCQLWARWVAAEAMVAAMGAVLCNKKTKQCYTNPWTGVANRSAELMKGYLVEFGLSPSSRSRVKVNPPAKEEDKFASLFGIPAPVGRVG